MEPTIVVRSLARVAHRCGASPRQLRAGGLPIGSLAVWDRGAAIYYANYKGGMYKVAAGKIYPSDIVVGEPAALHYDPVNRLIYAFDRSITAHTPSLSGSGGESSVVHAASTKGPGCTADGVSAAAACVNAHFGGDVRADGSLFFIDEQQLFYLNEGALHCHDLGSGEAWCNNTTLGPPTGLRPIARGPDQLSWLDSRSLLLSNYQGEIYRYALPP